MDLAEIRHQHVNFCLPPKGTPIGLSNMSEFGLRGSIVTEDACDAANGRWYPVVFGWMVHVYPLEQKPEDIWSVERQASGHMD